MLTNKQKGYLFEKRVEDFLKTKGYSIITKNFTIKGGEIDLIAEKNGIIHFIEVKGTTKNFDFQDYITKGKVKALERTAKMWIAKNEKYEGYQFDLVLVSGEDIDLIENFLF